MSSRDAILGRIQKALKNAPPSERPEIPEVWPRENPSTEKLVERFTTELEAVTGEFVRAASLDEAKQKLAALVDECGWKSLGAMDRPTCREAASDVPSDRIAWADANGTPETMGHLDASLIEADTILADTGSLMIACGTPQDRILCYLPPVCIILARTEQLVEHMPAAWEKLSPRVADPDLRGEFVFITGPSRTADIEKILILGVHGPKRLIVLLVGS